MKKRIAVFLAALMLLSLCGCKSKAAKETDELILKIGEVTASSTDEVERAQSAYDAPRGRRVYDDASRALHLGVHRQIHDAQPLCKPAADAREHRNIRRVDEHIRDYRLGRVGVYGEYRVRVNIADDSDVSGKHKGADALAIYDYPRALLYLLRYAQGKAPQLAVDLRRKRLGLFTFKYYL